MASRHLISKEKTETLRDRDHFKVELQESSSSFNTTFVQCKQELLFQHLLTVYIPELLDSVSPKIYFRKTW